MAGHAGYNQWRRILDRFYECLPPDEDEWTASESAMYFALESIFLLHVDLYPKLTGGHNINSSVLQYQECFNSDVIWQREAD